MSFRPAVSNHITIETVDYTFTEHPSARGMPYGQTGRRATVYQVQDVFGRFHALKVFSQSFRSEHNEQVAERLQRYASLPGLQVCARRVLTPQRHADLIRQYPDLSYAVLMPWVYGQTWQEIIVARQPMSPDQSLALARGFATLLASMEQNGLAHCDLSGPNVIVPPVAPGMTPLVTLVDVEEMFGPGLDKPEKLPGGSSGYAHRTARAGLWRADADRFAGAILLSEMLAWCEPAIRRISGAEQFFLDVELQTSNPKYNALGSALTRIWGKEIASLFYRALTSPDVSTCPTFTEWLQTLQHITQKSAVIVTPASEPTISYPQPAYAPAVQLLPHEIAFAPSIRNPARSHTPVKPSNRWLWIGAITFVMACLASGLSLGWLLFGTTLNTHQSTSSLPKSTIPPVQTREIPESTGLSLSTEVVLPSPPLIPTFTSLPPVVIPPTATARDLRDPADFARWYFNELWTTRNYRYLWDNCQTSSFQNHSTEGKGYSDFENWWSSVRQIDVHSVEVLQNDSRYATIRVSVTFHLNNGRSLEPKPYSYDLVWNTNAELWMFDYRP